MKPQEKTNSLPHVEAVLQNALDIAVNNAPIQRKEGNVEQAELNEEVARQLKVALEQLKKFW